MSSLNNFQPSNIRRTPYVSTLNNSLLSNPQVASNTAMMDVFTTPIQSTHLSKIGSIQSPLNDTPPKSDHLANSNPNSSNLKLEPGFVSSASNSRLSGPNPSAFSSSHLSLSNYTPANPVLNAPTVNRASSLSTQSGGAIKHYHSNNIQNSNFNSANSLVNHNNNNSSNNSSNNLTNINNNNNNSNGNNLSATGYHSRYPSDVTDHHEPYDHSNFILNTPERALLSLPNPIQLPHSYIHPTKPLNQYSPYESAPSSLTSHAHSMSLDTVTSTYSNKSLANEDWFGGPHHKHTYSNTSSINTPPSEDSSLMDLAREYADSSIEELAAQVKKLEKELSDTSFNVRNAKENRNLHVQRKKQQQLFALASLMKTVRVSENSVCPRNVVYSRYVDICKKHGVNQICNAAFGKLVKVFYPGIKTRRLGVRGSSRYNYCGIELIVNDTSRENETFGSTSHWNSGTKKEIEEEIVIGNSNTHSITPHSEVRTGTDEHIITDEEGGKEGPRISGASYSNKPPFLPGKSLELAFEQDLFTKLDSGVEFVPDFYRNIDSDIKESHKIILENYCEFLLQLFKDWRYLKIESLFNEIDNFSFETRLSHEYYAVYEMEYEELAPLIKQCYLECCKSAIKLISKIVFQQVPENVQTALCNFENCYVDHIRKMNFKKCIIEDNVEIATSFIHIISILRKVVYLSSSASKLLSANENKTSFCKEWDEINVPQIIENHPLIPKNEKSHIIEKVCAYLSKIFRSLGEREDGSVETNISNCRDNIIRKLSISFASIPPEFFNVEPRKLLLYVDAIGSTILRELTVENYTSSFSVWWSVVCWCNEYMVLMAEIGGFLK